MGFVRTVKAGYGFIFSSIKKRKEESLEDFYINRFGRPLYEMFFEDYTEKLWGVHPSKISPSWGAQRVKELSLSKAIKEMFVKAINKNHKSKQTSLIEQFIYPKKGPGQLWEAMVEEIQNMGGQILFNSKVVSTHIENNTIKEVTIKDKNGNFQNISADIFLSTMPIKDLVASMENHVPENIRKIAENLPYRDFITVGLLLNKLKIKNSTHVKTVGNIVPDCWVYIQERDVKIGRLQIFNNWSPYMVKDNENTVWIGLEYFCSEGDTLWNMSGENFIKFAIKELCKIDIIDEKDILDSTHIRVKKDYPAYFGTYQHFDKVKNFLDEIENLYCLGRNGQHRYNNMDHSMLTAIEAVRIIRKEIKDKSAIWDVNTKKDYHEGK